MRISQWFYNCDEPNHCAMPGCKDEYNGTNYAELTTEGGVICGYLGYCDKHKKAMRESE